MASTSRGGIGWSRGQLIDDAFVLKDSECCRSLAAAKNLPSIDVRDPQRIRVDKSTRGVGGVAKPTSFWVKSIHEPITRHASTLG